MNASCGVTFYMAEVISLRARGGQYLDIVAVVEEKLIFYISNSRNTVTSIAKVMH